MNNIDIGQIIKCIDEYLEKSGKEFTTPVEANKFLDEKDVLSDSDSRPGLPLRIILRSGVIPNAEQSTGGKYGRWRIYHS